jgi:hypothetical protein
MKKTLTLAAVLAAALILPTGAFSKAPKGTGGNNKNNKNDSDPAAKYDTNHNGLIDKGPEADALRAAFDANKDGPLKKYDTNHNGNLEDSEIAAIHVPIHKGK